MTFKNGESCEHCRYFNDCEGAMNQEPQTVRQRIGWKGYEICSDFDDIRYDKVC